MHLLRILCYKTLKLKSISNELWKGWKLAWYHHFTHIACARKYRGLRQKLDALRVQNKQSLSKYEGFIRKFVCYKGISFLTYLNSIVFLCSKCTIQSHIINLQLFLTSFVIFRAFTDYFELQDHEIEKHLKWTLKRFQVGMVLSFHPHSMCKKVQRLTAKTGRTSCTKRTISFEVSRFHTETRLLQRDFNFLNLFELHCFSMFKMHHSKPHNQFTTLSDFICYFSCIYCLFWAIRPWNWKAFEMNSEKVPSWHGIIISPT